MPTTKDLREYLKALESHGDLRRITREVSTDLEVAAIARRSTERRAPAPLFENIAGVAQGFRMLGATGALSSDPNHPLARIALSLGLSHDSTSKELVEHYVQAKKKPLIPPKVVLKSQAPCKQNILLGNDATLDRFPIPLIHPNDGGRYANTWGIIVARTPDGRWTNWSISRIQMIDGRRMTGLVLPQQHIGMIWKEWEKLGKPMPFAVVQGGHPGAAVVGGMPVPAEVDEGAFLGALCGEAVEVTKCETNDLFVPATAEIVIEGHMTVTRGATEGPFAEFHGWALSETSPEPIYNIEAITYRNDPIWPVCSTGRPPDDSQVGPSLGVSAEVLALLQSAGLPIASAWLPTEAACHWLIVTVQKDWRKVLPGVESAELIHRIGQTMSANRVGRMCPVTYVVDDDIDPASMSDVLWALGTRVHPNRRQESWEVTILPWYLCYSEHERHTAMGSIAVHDCLLPPIDDPTVKPATFDNLYPADLRARILAAESGAV